MNSGVRSKPFQLLIIGVLAWPTLSSAQHLNTGALGTNQDSQLIFANAEAFVQQSGYVGKLIYTNAGTYGSYYGFGLNPTVLPATVANGGPVANAPALGSFIKMRIESVTGPTNGSFAFWDTGATNPTVVATVGDSGPSPLFALSDTHVNAGLPGADPFGHIHGRRFTLSKMGNYTVGFRVFDTSTNGANNGPIHRPSDVLYIDLTTSVSLAMKSLQRINGHSLITFHQGGITNVVVESAPTPVAEAWTAVAGPFTDAPFGPNSTTTILDTNSPMDHRIYRLRGTAP